ncbi:MAG: hypothetical protein IPJ34_32125 [Myxococcales bacterium]|nr:hypothetical protein [Myxococcales bacterium]
MKRGSVPSQAWRSSASRTVDGGGMATIASIASSITSVRAEPRNSPARSGWNAAIASCRCAASAMVGPSSPLPSAPASIGEKRRTRSTSACSIPSPISRASAMDSAELSPKASAASRARRGPNGRPRTIGPDATAGASTRRTISP